jgi:putative proteasome-type protease
MQVEEVPGERVLVMLSAGNLAITQAVWNRLQEGVFLAGTRQTLRDAPNMFHAARLVGQAVRDVWRDDQPALGAQGIGFDVSLLFGGQIAGDSHRLYLIYSAGNFIEATADTSFLQIGEIKYGKPILDRGLTFETALLDGVKLALISMDGTIRSNLTVGPPFDLLLCRAGSLKVGLRHRIAEEDPYLCVVRDDWAKALHEAYLAMPRPDWGTV